MISPLIILPPGALLLAGWSLDTPTRDLPDAIDPQFCIPHVDDIRPILADQPRQYVAGMCSVTVSAHGKSMATHNHIFLQLAKNTFLGRTYAVHFCDVRRWSNAFYFCERVSKTRRVLETVDQHNLLTGTERKALLSLSADSPLPGFPPSVTSPSLSTLHELIDENWLGERIIDTYIHLLVQQLNTSFPNLILFLDCYFHLELSLAFERRRLSPRLRQIREAIIADPPQLIAFLLNKESVHWASNVTVLGDWMVLQGDSAGFSRNMHLREMLEWWLGDIAPEDGLWSEGILPTERQGPRSGSCGLATVGSIMDFALDFACRDVEVPITIPQWTDACTASVRRYWLRTILSASLQSLSADNNEVCCDIL
jgi:hypothetical protein